MTENPQEKPGVSNMTRPEKSPRPARFYGIPEGSVEPFALAPIAAKLHDDPAYARDGRASFALARSGELTVILTALRKGAKTPDHLTPGPAAAVILSGRLKLITPEAVRELGEHDSAILAAEIPHVIEALADSAFVTIIGGKEPAI